VTAGIRPALGEAIGGADAVICTIAGARRRDPHRLADVSRVLVPAVTDAGVRRLVVTSAYGMVAERPRLLAPLVRRLLAVTFADGREMERIVSAGDVDWTIVRPPKLTNGSPRGAYRASQDLFVKGPFALARRDLAAALLDITEDHAYARKAVNVVAA
jgi:putative NADH-flavin reductase